MASSTQLTDEEERYRDYAVGIVDRAISKGLSDRSTISHHVVRRKLKPRSQGAYVRVMVVWREYENRFHGSDPRDMQTMKHFAEVIGLGMKAKLDKEKEMTTTWSVRCVMRRFYNQWERAHHTTIPGEVKLSMEPYINGELADKIGLSKEMKDKTFMTISIFVNLYNYQWAEDGHDYKHEGSRVDASTILLTHSVTSGRLQEVCGAKYKDLICLVGWKDGEPDIKMDFKRENCKGLDYKKPEHPFAERFEGGLVPPLFSQPMLWWLVNFISAGAFEDYKTIEDVFSVRPPKGETYWMMDWNDNVLDRPVFPQWSVDGPTDKTKGSTAWANDVKSWGIRAGILELVIHAIRREILIKVNDSGASIGQVLKFAAQKNPKVLGNHYLHDLTTVDGPACFLGLKPRTDLTEDFRTATMKRNPDLAQSLPSNIREKLHQQKDYISISLEIDDLSSQINATADEEKRCLLRAERNAAYKRRAKLENDELKKHHKTTKRVHPGKQKHQNGAASREDSCRTNFDRIRHMLPERDRLARTLFLPVPLRSPEAISAMRDLIALRTEDCRVAYQEVLRPVRVGRGEFACRNCGTRMESIPVGSRWNHVFRCQERVLKAKHGFAEFCYRPACSKWITGETEWDTHCQGHIDDGDIPFKCDPVKFRHAIACAGYNPFRLCDESLPAADRMHQHTDRSAWQRDYLRSSSEYVKKQRKQNTFSCPMQCPGSFGSENELWYHLEDVHKTPQPSIGTKRKSHINENLEDTVECSRPVKLRRGRKLSDDESIEAKFIHVSAADIAPTPMDSEAIIPDDSSLSSSCSTPGYSLFDSDTKFSSGVSSPASFSPPLSCASTPFTDFPSVDEESTIVSWHTSLPVLHERRETLIQFALKPPTSIEEDYDQDWPDLPLHLEGTDTIVSPRDIFAGDGLFPPEAPADYIDPSLTGDGALLEQMDGLEDLYDKDIHQMIPDAAARSGGLMAEPLPSSLGSVLEEDSGKTTPVKPKITRIVIKVSGSRKSSPADRSEDDIVTDQSNAPASELCDADCLLDKWGEDVFVEKVDGTCCWKPRKSIKSKELIAKLDKEHRGLYWGVDVLRASRDQKGVWYLVRWKGGEWKDDWVLEKYIHPELSQQHRPSKKAKRRRRRN